MRTPHFIMNRTHSGRSSPPTVHMLSPLPGIRRSDCGSLRLAKPHGASSDTPTMFCLSLSPQITDKLSLGARDRTIKLWNTLGDCKYTITDKGHTEWVSCVRFSPNPQNPVIVSAGWDKLVKVNTTSPLHPTERHEMMPKRLYYK